MNLPIDLTKRIAAHLDDVRKYLGSLPADERQEILQSIEAHIYDALESRSNGEPTSSLLEAVIAEMDPPESYGELTAVPKKNRRWFIPALFGAVLAIVFVTYHREKGAAENHPTHQTDHSKIFLKPVEQPSIPQPPPGKYAFQIIKVTAPAEIIQSPQADVEKILRRPEIKVSEYPVLVTGLGESTTNDQTEAVSMDVDYGLVDGKPVTKEKTFRLGDSISVTANKIEDGTISYHLNIHHLELNGFFESKLENGFITKTQPRFKKEAVDTDLTQKLNSWMLINGIIEPQPNGKDINQITCVRVIPSVAIQAERSTNRVTFEQTSSALTNGDSIVLDEIRSSSPNFAIGDTVTAKGRYVLASQPEATLLLTATATQGSGHSSTTEKQRITVLHGSGDFELTYTIPYHGCSHLAFYNKITGQSLGGLWFGTKEQVNEMHKEARTDSSTTDIDTLKGTTMKQPLALTAAAMIAATNLIAGEPKPGSPLLAAANNASSKNTVVAPPIEVKRVPDGIVAKQKELAKQRMREDSSIYSQEELREIESLYQVANKQWRSEEGKESLRKLISKYSSANRTGCALLYLGQMSTGDDQINYLKQAIENFSDCFYGNGVQVGAYARFVLLCRYRNDGEKEKAEKLAEEIRVDYPDAIDHRGRTIVELIKANTD